MTQCEGMFLMINGDFIVIYGDLMGFNWIYPLGMTNIWKMAIEIVDFPNKHGDFLKLC